MNKIFINFDKFYDDYNEIKIKYLKEYSKYKNVNKNDYQKYENNRESKPYNLTEFTYPEFFEFKNRKKSVRKIQFEIKDESYKKENKLFYKRQRENKNVFTKLKRFTQFKNRESKRKSNRHLESQVIDKELYNFKGGNENNLEKINMSNFSNMNKDDILSNDDFEVLNPDEINFKKGHLEDNDNEDNIINNIKNSNIEQEFNIMNDDEDELNILNNDKVRLKLKMDNLKDKDSIKYRNKRLRKIFD